MRITQPRNWAEVVQHFQATPPENPGGGGTPPEGRRPSTEVLAQYGGDAIRMAERVSTLEGENYRYREAKRDHAEEIRKRDERIAALEGKQTPDGAVVLAGDEAKMYEAYKALGKPEEIRAGLDERQTLATEVAAAKRDTTLRDVADAGKFEFRVLKRLGADREYEVRDVTDAEGKAARVPHIKDTDGTFKPLADYAQADPEWSVFYPVLTGQATTGGTTPPPARPTGTFPPQRPSVATPPGNLAAQFVKQRNDQGAAKVNPLAPAPIR